MPMAGIRRHAFTDLTTIHSQIYIIKFGQMQNEFNLVKAVVSFYKKVRQKTEAETNKFLSNSLEYEC